MDSSAAQLVQLLPHNESDAGSVLTCGAVCVEVTHSSCSHMYFLQAVWFVQTSQGTAGWGPKKNNLDSKSDFMVRKYLTS